MTRLRVIFDDSGLELVDVGDADADEHVVFVGRRPAGRELWRQIGAG